MVIVGVMVKLPPLPFLPVLIAALKNFTAAGAGVPAGTIIGYEMLLVGFVVQELLHDVLTPVMFEAVVDNECAPDVNVVEVIVRFQPDPLPPFGVFATVRPSE